jgi:hypothetical protein
LSGRNAWGIRVLDLLMLALGSWLVWRIGVTILDRGGAGRGGDGAFSRAVCRGRLLEHGAVRRLDGDYSCRRRVAAHTDELKT